MGGGPERDGADGVVAGERQVGGVGHGGDLAALGEAAAPGEVGHDDVAGGLLDPGAEAEAGEDALALADRDRGLGLQADEGVDVVGGHDLLEPEDVVGLEGAGDAGGGGQVPAGVAFDGDRHPVADGLADVVDDGDAAGEVVVGDAVAEGAGGGDRTPDGDRLALAAGAGEGRAELVEGPDLHRGDALGEEVGGELAGAALPSQASRSGYFP